MQAYNNVVHVLYAPGDQVYTLTTQICLTHHSSCQGQDCRVGVALHSPPGSIVRSSTTAKSRHDYATSAIADAWTALSRYQAQPLSEETLLLEQQRAEDMLQAASAGIAPSAQELPQTPDPAIAGVLPNTWGHRGVTSVVPRTGSVPVPVPVHQKLPVSVHAP